MEKRKFREWGHASPVIWEDRIFLVSADEESQARSLMCLDRISGEIKWSKGVLKSPLEDIHRLNSRASSTPVTDGERIFVSFLDGEKMFVAAYDLEGNQLWQQRPGVFSSKHGYCSCPVLWKNMVIVNGDHDGRGLHCCHRSEERRGRSGKRSGRIKCEATARPLFERSMEGPNSSCRAASLSRVTIRRMGSNIG